MDPGEVLVRHTADQLAVSSPGGFIAGITTRNILRHEPRSRKRREISAARSRGRNLGLSSIRARLVESGVLYFQAAGETEEAIGKPSPG
jgi:ATP-dependent DNA helicase RecG